MASVGIYQLLWGRMAPFWASGRGKPPRPGHGVTRWLSPFAQQGLETQIWILNFRCVWWRAPTSSFKQR